jgi:hypothetical protein
VGLIAGKGGRYHADPSFSGYGILKVGDLYRQQLRLHAWKVWNGRPPGGQLATLRRVDGSHGYGTKSARSGLVVGSGNHRLAAYTVAWRGGNRGNRFMGPRAPEGSRGAQEDQITHVERGPGKAGSRAPEGP